MANELVTLLDKIGIKNIDDPNRISKQVTITQNTKDNYETFVETVDKYGIQLKTNVQCGLISMVNAMMCWREKLALYEEQNLLENLKFALKDLLEHAKNDTGKLASALFSEIRFIKKDLGSIRLQDAKQQYALAHFLHSEQLAYIWLMKRSVNPVPYMYTQRGMCETCNPFVLKALNGAPTRFYILSTYVAHRPGRDQDIETDGTYELDTDGVTMHLEYEPKYLPVIRIRDKNSAMSSQATKNTDDDDPNQAVNAEKAVLDELSKTVWKAGTQTFQSWVAEQREKK